MDKIYKVNIPYSLSLAIKENELIEYGSKLVKESIKRDFGIFAFDDYKVIFKKFICEPAGDSLNHNWYYVFEITENLETKKMIMELEERLRIGL